MKDIGHEYDTFLKHLIILSYNKETQLNLIGTGEENVAGHICIDYCLSYDFLENFDRSKFINHYQKTEIKNFYDYINDSNDGDLDSEAWTKIREKASHLINILNANHFNVELDKTGTYWETKLIK